MWLLIRFVGNVVVVEVDEGSNAELQCNVDATPLTNSTLVWKRDGYDFGNISTT